MGNRLELHEVFCNILGSRNAYFQPPASVKMNYPAIKYSLYNIENNNADDLAYKRSKAYEVILIDYDPDSSYVDKISQLPYCRFDRYYPADNLNHYVFTLYY
jgi:hypothetical protein